MKRKILIISIIGCLILAMGILYFFVYEDPMRGTMQNKTYNEMMGLNDFLTYEEAKADIDYLYELIRSRHYSAIDKTVSDDVEQAYQIVISQLKQENSLFEMWRNISLILHELDDGHARTGFMYSETPLVYDMTLDIVSRSEWYIDLDGYEYPLVSMHGMSIEDIYDVAKETFSYENEYYLNYLLESRLVYTAYEYYFTGNWTAQGNITYMDDQQSLVSFQMQVIPLSPSERKVIDYEIDQDQSVGLLKMNQMVNDQESKDMIYAFFNDVKTYGIDYVVIDISQNGGGNSLIIEELLRYFPVETYMNYGTGVRYRLFDLNYQPREVKNNIYETLKFEGQVYLITSPKTFSSAAMLTAIFKDNELGIIYGEPMGNQPSMYGDILQYQLKNSGFPITLTYKFFTRPNGVLTDETIMPDVLIKSEQAYQKILEDIRD